MNLWAAIRSLEDGKVVRRPGWANVVYISLELPSRGQTITEPFFMARLRDLGERRFAPWTPSTADVLAEDWYEVQR